MLPPLHSPLTLPPTRTPKFCFGGRRGKEEPESRQGPPRPSHQPCSLTAEAPAPDSSSDGPEATQARPADSKPYPGVQEFVQEGNSGEPGTDALCSALSPNFQS